MAGFEQIGSDGNLTAEMWNGNVDALELAHTAIMGRGVVTGLVLSVSAGLSVAISNGVVATNKATTLTSIPAFAVDNASTRYLWIDNEGTVTQTASDAYPGGQVACLGKVVTLAGAITSITEDNRDEVIRRVSKDVIGIGKTLEINEDTLAATFAGAVAIPGIVSLDGQLREGVNVQTLSATLQLDASSPNTHALKTNGSVQIVKLPTNAVMATLADDGFGLVFRILNTDAAKALTIQTGGGATLLSLQPGRYKEIRPTLHASGYATFDVLATVGPKPPFVRQLYSPAELMNYIGYTTTILFGGGVGATPGTRACEMTFWPLQISCPGDLQAFFMAKSVAPSTTTPKQRFMLYKRHATTRMPDVPYSTADIQAPISYATALIANTNTLRYPLDAAIKWNELRDWLAGDPFVYVACMGEMWYTTGGGTETAPTCRGHDYRISYAPIIGATLYERPFKYVPALANIAVAWPTGIGNSTGNFAQDTVSLGPIALGLDFTEPTIW